MQQLMPDWKWAEYFKEINVITPGNVNVGQPEFFKAANEVFKSTLQLTIGKHIYAGISSMQLRRSSPRISLTKTLISRSGPFAALKKSNRAGNASSLPPTTQSAKRSANCTWRSISRQRPKRARSNS